MEFVQESDSPFEFDFDINGVLALTADNVARIQFLIGNDSRYRDSKLDELLKECPDFLSRELLQDGSHEEVVQRAVEAIDRVNSTHQASEGPRGGANGFKLTARCIADIKDVRGRLKDNDPHLVDEIACAFDGRYTFSFATKFCAYVSRGLFGPDGCSGGGYSIYDSVVSRALPYYAWVYAGEKNRLYKGQCVKDPYEKFKDKKFKDQKQWQYKRYHDLIGKIILENEKKIGYRISRMDFDQLLWYYYKGEGPRLAKSRELISEDRLAESRGNFVNAESSFLVMSKWAKL